MSKNITKDTLVEDLIKEYPDVVSYFIQRGVNPVSCSGPFPYSLGTLLDIKKVEDIDGFVEGLNDFIKRIEKP
ncbi:MAG TPA: hypothetical protein HA341_05210 [Halobacteria archaeon]|jgi:hypothetical protein|nr:hypothetical protein [Halobacteria archaeon]